MDAERSAMKRVPKDSDWIQTNMSREHVRTRCGAKNYPDVLWETKHRTLVGGDVDEAVNPRNRRR